MDAFLDHELFMKRSVPRFDAASLCPPAQTEFVDDCSSKVGEAPSLQEPFDEEPNLIEQMANKLRGRLKRRPPPPEH